MNEFASLIPNASARISIRPLLKTTQREKVEGLQCCQRVVQKQYTFNSARISAYPLGNTRSRVPTGCLLGNVVKITPSAHENMPRAFNICTAFLAITLTYCASLGTRDFGPRACSYPPAPLTQFWACSEHTLAKLYMSPALLTEHTGSHTAGQLTLHSPGAGGGAGPGAAG